MRPHRRNGLRPAVAVPAGLLASSLLSGCALLPVAPAPPLLSPASFGGTARAEQILHVRRGEHGRTLQCYVEVTPSKLTLVGTSAHGQRVLTLHLDERGLHADSLLPEGALDPAQVLADLQLALWPLPALQAGLGPAWRVHEPRPGTRVALRDGETYAEIRYGGRTPWEGRLWLVNFEGRYSVDIDSHALEQP